MKEIKQRDSPIIKDTKQRESPIRKEYRQRESPVRKELKPREYPDRNRRENFDYRPAAKITYEASPKRYVSSTKEQSSLK